METAEENERMHSARDVQRAKIARNAHQAAGSPSMQDFKHMIHSNVIKDCPITLEDMRKAELICGKDVGALKGKTTKTKNAPYVRDLMVPPKALIQRNRDVTLHVDTLYVNGMPFLATISKNIMYRTAEFVAGRQLKSGGMNRSIGNVLPPMC